MRWEGLMSTTPKLADECKKLLDNGHRIVLMRNRVLGTYTAIAVPPGKPLRHQRPDEAQTTDDFEPSQALYRLTEKVFGNIV